MGAQVIQHLLHLAHSCHDGLNLGKGRRAEYQEGSRLMIPQLLQHWVSVLYAAFNSNV